MGQNRNPYLKKEKIIMIKLPRFVHEYANYKRAQIREMDSRNVYRPISLMDIDNIIKNMEKGLITINEGMERLATL